MCDETKKYKFFTQWLSCITKYDSEDTIEISVEKGVTAHQQRIFSANYISLVKDYFFVTYLEFEIFPAIFVNVGEKINSKVFKYVHMYSLLTLKV